MSLLRDLIGLLWVAHGFILLALWSYAALHITKWFGGHLTAWLLLTFAACPVYIFIVTRPAVQRLGRRINVALGVQADERL